jgi:hypothetical protein
MEINFSLQRAKNGLKKLSTGKIKTTKQRCRDRKEANDEIKKNVN